jgi:ferredoxin
MSLLELDISRCVRVTNKFSECVECVDACPVEVIKISQHLPSFVPSECIGCGGCLSACPSSAYKLDDFNALEFIFSLLESSQCDISCKIDKIPCFAALSVEEMLSLSILSQNDISMDKTHCVECVIAHKNLPIIEKRVDEVNFLLQAMQIDKQIEFQEWDENQKSADKQTSRRDFLSKITIKEALDAKEKFKNTIEALDEELKQHYASTKDIQNIRAKFIPDSRKLLSMALKRVEKPNVYHVIDAENISFISEKFIDEDSCSACQMCYRICPTEALSSDKYGGFIDFNPALCIKCSSCHDVCESNSIIMSPTFYIKEVFEPKKKRLVEFSIKRCDECAMPFVYRGGEVICARCRIEEEEANQLWGIK